MDETRNGRYVCSTSRCDGCKMDRLDLWQVHAVSFENDPDLFIRPGGAAEALAPMSPVEMQSLCDRCHFDASDGRWESKDTL